MRLRCDQPMCKHFRSRREGDGGSTFLCDRLPGLVLGGINLVEYDLAYEIDDCHSSRHATSHVAEE